MSNLTHLFTQMESGDPSAVEQLLRLVYSELRKLAAKELHKEPSGNTLQPTALVHEAYLRLMEQSSVPQWDHRGHFYAAAAEAMRRILVESARRKQTLKRGGDRERISIDVTQITAPHRHPVLLALDEALERLAVDQPEIARLVSLRYLAGLRMPQTARAIGTSLRTTERNWTYAKAWLLEAIGNDR